MSASIPSELFLTVDRDQTNGLPRVRVAPETFPGNALQDVALYFHDKRSWRSAWRTMRAMVEHGFQAIPAEVFLGPDCSHDLATERPGATVAEAE
ncbi:hypothetical protein ACFSDD_09025 [Salipiger marinus]|uniref:hypothetical protein n=1 Tax=Salipiger marinus TaxID=555512 RepID=UPI002B98ECFF|nr:hypothetical protein [Salipiger manganoxidans]MEB3421919.1 hypothetical protein [Salipiger manganoxidans]